MNEPGTQAPWDPVTGTAGGAQFGAALARFASTREVPPATLAKAIGSTDVGFGEVLAGEKRVSVSVLARLVRALRARPIEFLQQTAILSLETYAYGVDPLYFLPEGPVRYEARIYMREINPRHAVPEADMTTRNPALKGLAEDPLLDPLGKIEMELAYLLRVLSQQLGSAG